jgi:hypothetical protein
MTTAKDRRASTREDPEDHLVVAAYIDKEMMPHSFSLPVEPVHLSFTSW